MLTSGLFKSFIKQVLKFYKLRNNSNSINSHWSHKGKKVKVKSLYLTSVVPSVCETNAQEKQDKRFLSISRVAKIVTIVAILCSFNITELYSFMKAKKSPIDFISFCFFGQLWKH